MNLDNQLLFFISALGAFNSTILSIYFFLFTKTKNTSNYFLAGLLSVLSIRIWKSLFFYFNPELSKIYLQIGLTACFFIGPFLYLYIISKSPDFQKKKNHWYLRLIILFTIVLVFGIVYPYESNSKLWTNYLYKIINYQWLVFIIISSFKMKSIFIKLKSKKPILSYDEVWVLSVFVGTLFIWLAYFTASYTSYISGALTFSFMFYLSALLIFYRRKKSFISSEKKEKYSNHKITKEDAVMLLNKIEATIKEKQLHKNPNLTLSQLAKELAIRPHLLSQLLNDNLQKSFPHFINEYRIEEAKKLLTNQRNVKMDVIAESCGFNSTSTFYTAFKKVTHTTPAKYESE